MLTKQNCTLLLWRRWLIDCKIPKKKKKNFFLFLEHLSHFLEHYFFLLAFCLLKRIVYRFQVNYFFYLLVFFLLLLIITDIYHSFIVFSAFRAFFLIFDQSSSTVLYSEKKKKKQNCLKEGQTLLLFVLLVVVGPHNICCYRSVGSLLYFGYTFNCPFIRAVKKLVLAMIFFFFLPLKKPFNNFFVQ